MMRLTFVKAILLYSHINMKTRTSLFLLMICLVVGSCSKGPREVCVYMDAVVANNSDSGGSTFDLQNSDGNYGVHTTDKDHIITDVITVPNGKKWKFDRDETQFEGVGGYHPMIYHYYYGDEDGSYRKYQTYDDARTMPVFRGGDKIRIVAFCDFIPNGKRMTLHTKVYFIEADDEFSK